MGAGRGLVSLRPGRSPPPRPAMHITLHIRMHSGSWHGAGLFRNAVRAELGQAWGQQAPHWGP